MGPLLSIRKSLEALARYRAAYHPPWYVPTPSERDAATVTYLTSAPCYLATPYTHWATGEPLH
jgi:hypothetical protein